MEVLPTTTKTTLELTEMFASIQGESTWTGLPTTFIRTARCNLRCSWCDTPYSFPRGNSYSLEAIVRQVETNGLLHVCITGGEPLLQENIHPLIRQLADKGYCVSIETGGSLSTASIDPRAKIILDIKCPGSGMEQKNHWENLSNLRPHDEVKFVIKDRNDYDWAKEIATTYRLFEKESPLLFSPVHQVLDPQDLIDWILNDQLPVRLNLQVHKWIWSPETRGV